MPAPYAVQWDRRDDFRSHAEVDFGDVGEDAKGVWAKQHPEVLLAQDELLWEIYSEFCLAPCRELGPNDASTRSHWWLVAWAHMLSALERDRHRRMEALAEKRRGAAVS
jgi:hypothetical protein